GRLDEEKATLVICRISPGSGFWWNLHSGRHSLGANKDSVLKKRHPVRLLHAMLADTEHRPSKLLESVVVGKHHAIYVDVPSPLINRHARPNRLSMQILPSSHWICSGDKCVSGRLQRQQRAGGHQAMWR